MGKRRDPNAPIWEQLPMKLLSPEGRATVSKDPDLSARTLKTLNKSEKTYLEGSLAKPHEWYLDAKEDGSDISAVLLACCINDNLDACMAEIVARYAGIRRLSFCEVANKLCELRKEGKLFCFTEDKSRTAWEPRVVGKRGRSTAKRRAAKEKGQQPGNSEQNAVC